VWEGNFMMDSGETGCKGVTWIHPARHSTQWRAFVHYFMNMPIQ
jgi:hypothetical protein